jgi:regulator of replication initiation timing
VSDEYNTIDGLLLLLSERKPNGCYYDQRYHAALTALVAERDGLRKRVEELDALKQRIADLESDNRAMSHNNAIMRERLKAYPPAVRDRELRERLVESALQGAGALSMLDEDTAKFLGRQAVWMVDGAIAEMRKGEADGK